MKDLTSDNRINYSIIIPHKDIPDLLQRCLDTIPQREDVQVIVVDDNSNPDIVDFAHFSGFDRADVECYFTKEGKGAGYARNVGLQHARGKWLLFADADDFFTDDLLTKLDKWKDTDNDIVYFRLSRDEYSSKTNSYRHLVYNGIINQYTLGEISLKECVKSIVIPTSKMISLRFVTDNKLRYDEIMYGNDVGFAARCALCVKTISISNDMLYVLTVRHNSLTKTSHLANGMKQMKTRLILVKQINNFFVQNGHSELCYEVRCWALRYSLSQSLGFCSLLLFLYTTIQLVRLGLHKPIYNLNNKNQESFFYLFCNVSMTYFLFNCRRFIHLPL